MMMMMQSIESIEEEQDYKLCTKLEGSPDPNTNPNTNPNINIRTHTLLKNTIAAQNDEWGEEGVSKYKNITHSPKIK
jgi:hypothetical protein